MNDIQAHRGPDGEGVFFNEVSLGHRRLSVIDLSEEASQPMIYKNYSIVFNGEIYNFKQIKTELIRKKHNFNTNSDTEVILHAFEEWGSHCVNKFNGMWAFCIYDKDSGRLFLSRDRFGIKPLYYYFDGDKFIFASEIKAILEHDIKLSIDKEAVNFYFYQKYITGDKTIYNEIKKLQAGYFMNFFVKTKSLETSKYYYLEKEIEKAKEISIKERKEQIKKSLDNAIENRLISDVPVGSFLSGGIDSSYISSKIAKKSNKFDVFTIGFKENSFDELKFAEIVAKNIKVKHHKEIIDIDEDMIFDVINKLDEPFGDPSLIPTFLLSKITKKKVTVALSGDAGDEVFGGYDTYKAYRYAKLIPYFMVWVLKKVTRFIPGSDKNLHISFKIKKFFNDFDKNNNTRHLNWMSQTNIETRKNLLRGCFREIKTNSKGDDLLSLQLNDFNNYLGNDILKKTDIASMLNSLEVRTPFLDYKLVPLVLSLPEKLKIKRFKVKWFLKEISKQLLPKIIINRKKQGFSVPLSIWFKKSKRIKQIILQKKYYKHELLNFDTSVYLLNEHILGKNDNSRVLWLIFVFNIWYFNNFVQIVKPGEKNF